MTKTTPRAGATAARAESERSEHSVPNYNHPVPVLLVKRTAPGLVRLVDPCPFCSRRHRHSAPEARIETRYSHCNGPTVVATPAGKPRVKWAGRDEGFIYRITLDASGVPR